jgi:quinolinate synthase
MPKKSDAQEFIVVTESGILHQMQKQSPHKLFLAAIRTPPQNTCVRNDCPQI